MRSVRDHSNSPVDVRAQNRDCSTERTTHNISCVITNANRSASHTGTQTVAVVVVVVDTAAAATARVGPHFHNGTTHKLLGVAATKTGAEYRRVTGINCQNSESERERERQRGWEKREREERERE